MLHILPQKPVDEDLFFTMFIIFASTFHTFGEEIWQPYMFYIRVWPIAVILLCAFCLWVTVLNGGYGSVFILYIYSLFLMELYIINIREIFSINMKLFFPQKLALLTFKSKEIKKIILSYTSIIVIVWKPLFKKFSYFVKYRSRR